MSDVMTRADSVRRYYTGAASDGGAQPDPNLSLGNHRANTEAQTYGIAIANAIANITVQMASGANAAGAGSLECTGVDSLRWKYLGGTYGPAVNIANGETKILEENTNPGAFLRVQRTSATPLVAGTSTITLTRLVNNLYGFDDVQSIEASAGDAEYRALMLKNVASNNITILKFWLALLGTSRISSAAQLSGSGGGTIGISSGTFADWPAKGWCQIQNAAGTYKETVYYSSRTTTTLTITDEGHRDRIIANGMQIGANDDLIHCVPGCGIAIDNAGVQAAGTAIQTIANENTSPAGVTWNNGITAATGLQIGTMTPGDQVGIWIWRDVPVGAGAIAAMTNRFKWSFDAI